MFGAIVTSLVGYLSNPDCVTYPDFSSIATLADVVGRLPKTKQPLELVVPSAVTELPLPLAMYVIAAVTPGTPTVLASDVTASISSPEPDGGVMIADRVTLGRVLPSASFAYSSFAQVTFVVSWTLAPLRLVVSLTLQPVPSAEPLLGEASWVILYSVPSIVVE